MHPGLPKTRPHSSASPARDPEYAARSIYRPKLPHSRARRDIEPRGAPRDPIITPNSDFLAGAADRTPGHTSEASDTGLVRASNDDSYAALPELGLWAVADGLGGHGAGEIAGAIAVSVVVKEVMDGATLAGAPGGAPRDP